MNILIRTAKVVPRSVPLAVNRSVPSAVHTLMVALLALVIACSEERSQTGRIVPKDTLTLNVKGLGQTLWGARFVERSGRMVVYVNDEDGLYREYDVEDGMVTDEIDLGQYLESAGLDRQTMISGMVWLSEHECMPILLRTEPFLMICDTKLGTASVVDLKDSIQGRDELMPGCIPSICEPRLVGKDVVAVPMQLAMNDLFTNPESRLRRYTLSPLTLLHLDPSRRDSSRHDSSHRTVRMSGRGRFPDLYRDSLVRVQYYSVDVVGDELYLAFGRTPNIHQYSIESGKETAVLTLPMPIEFNHVPFDPHDNTSSAFREYFYQTSRAHALKVLPSGEILRTFIPGRTLASDGIVERNHDRMDWVIAAYTREGKAKFYNVSGDDYLNTFFGVNGSDVYLQSVSSTTGSIHIVRVELLYE